MVEQTALLQKAALVAQKPDLFEEVAELDDGEREALRNETLHKWRQPRKLYFTIILCSIGVGFAILMDGKRPISGSRGAPVCEYDR